MSSLSLPYVIFSRIPNSVVKGKMLGQWFMPVITQQQLVKFSLSGVCYSYQCKLRPGFNLVITTSLSDFCAKWVMVVPDKRIMHCTKLIHMCVNNDFAYFCRTVGEVTLLYCSQTLSFSVYVVQPKLLNI